MVRHFRYMAVRGGGALSTLNAAFPTSSVGNGISAAELKMALAHGTGKVYPRWPSHMAELKMVLAHV